MRYDCLKYLTIRYTKCTYDASCSSRPVRTKWAGHTRLGNFRPEGKVRLGSCLCMKCTCKIRWCKDCENIFCGIIFLNIKLWFIVIRYLMISSWRHNACFIYSCRSNHMYMYVWSLKVMWAWEVHVYTCMSLLPDSRGGEEEEVITKIKIKKKTTTKKTRCFTL